MKTNSTHNYWIPLAVAATLMGRLVVPAQDWETVDDFASAGGDAEAHGVAVAADGGIYVVGTANGHGIVRYSADDGSNWITRDDFVYPSETNTLFNAVTVDSRGVVFVGGGAALSRVGHWLVRRSQDQGVSWDTVDDYFAPRNGPLQEGTNGVVYSLATDGQGRVYGGGVMLLTGPSYPSWWIRGSSIGGTNWDTELVAFGGYSDFAQLTCAGEDVYALGTADEGAFTARVILKSSDHGVTWIKDFESTNDLDEAITADSGGYLYSAGVLGNDSTSVVWQVRQAAPGQTNWVILDSSSYQDGSSGYGIDQPVANSIAVDAVGNVCATGQFIHYWVKTDTNGTMYGSDATWFTRQYLAADGQWRTTDLFSYSTNRQGAALGTAIAPSGSAFVAGYGTSDSGQRHWVVRRRAAPIVPPALRIACAGGNGAVCWPAAYTNAVLQWADSPDVNSNWQNVTDSVSVVNGLNTAAFDLTIGARFFRLKSTSGR